MTEPTDAEIESAWAEATGSSILPYPDDMLAFARAVLAKWGVLRAEKIVIPTDTMEQEFQKHYRRGYEAGQKASTPQPTQAQAGAVPLTDEQARELVELESWGPDATTLNAQLLRTIRRTEAAHGIKGGQHGPA